MARPAIPHLLIKLNVLLRRSNNDALAARRRYQDHQERCKTQDDCLSFVAIVGKSDVDGLSRRQIVNTRMVGQTSGSTSRTRTPQLPCACLRNIRLHSQMRYCRVSAYHRYVLFVLFTRLRIATQFIKFEGGHVAWRARVPLLAEF